MLEIVIHNKRETITDSRKQIFVNLRNFHFCSELSTFYIVEWTTPTKYNKRALIFFLEHAKGSIL